MANEVALSAKATADKKISVVKKPSHADQATQPCAEAIAVGDAIRLDTTTARWTKANGTAAGEARATHIATHTAAAGESLTGVRGCLLDGYVLDALAYDDPVYLSDTDGRLSTVVGTVTILIGRVVPGFAQTLGTAADKLLDVVRLV